MKPRPAFPFFVALLITTAVAAGCSRAPSNAYEAREMLPRAFAGKVSENDRGPARTLRLPTDSLRVRDEHTLEFESVRFLMLNPLDDSILMDETVPARGTVTIPGGEIRLESVGAEGAAGAVEAASFVGRLADDCRSAEASWQMQGQKETLRLKAVK